jgi:hypothetical protein
MPNPAEGHEAKKQSPLPTAHTIFPKIRTYMVVTLAAGSILAAGSPADDKEAAPVTPPPRWNLTAGSATEWPVDADTRLPHRDFIEQGGLRVGQVVTYQVNAERVLAIKRSVVWPGLRTIPNNTHASLTHSYGAEAEPAIAVDGVPLGGIMIAKIVLDGTLTFRGNAASDIAVTRCSFPSTEARVAIDRWTLRNTGAKARSITAAPMVLRHQVTGPYGTNVMEVFCTAPAASVIAPGQELTFAVLFSGRLDGETRDAVNPVAEEASRRTFAASINRSLRLETPEPELDQAFAFCKLRVAEAINATRGGMMLAPGGLSYYAAVWCNDNVEYAGPFFPFLGDPNGNQASLDTYRLYRKFMKSDYGKIPSSIVAEGTDIWDGAGDRGDAAMYAYGCARFCLARGDKGIAEELWPGIEWCLEYCKRQTTSDGVVASDSDELEGRFPAGKANLSTSSLCYGGLRSAADLGRALGRLSEAAEYDRRAVALAQAIEKYFGANVEGFATYRYYDGNNVLRSWICLPLCMGLMDRRDATIAALFSPRLWTDDGLATASGDRTFWDRSTLYGFRGVLRAGASAKAMPFLRAYTHRRLLGDHVPYPVEAWPEGGQRHLSSESGLYCSVYIDGLFGIQPSGLDSFRCTPRLPDGWSRMALRAVRAFGRNFDVEVERKGKKLLVKVIKSGRKVVEFKINEGDSAEVKLP